MSQRKHNKLTKVDIFINDMLNKRYIRMRSLNKKGEVLYEITKRGAKYLKSFEEGLRRLRRK